MSTLSTTNIKHPSSASNNVVLDSSGRVGVGSSSPKETIDCRGAAVFSGDHATGANAYDTAHGIMLSSTSGLASIKAVSNGANNVDIRFIPLSSGSGSEAVRIDSSGNLKFNSGYGSVATAYGCRAWINFNGTGAISIRDSKGVSSLTDNGTGNYNVNLSITLPDTNGVVLGNKHHSTSPGGLEGLAGASFIDTSTLRILSGDWTNTYINSNLYDSPYLMAAIIR